jgi:hypothetical protein
MCGVSDNTEKTDTFVTDITEPPICSVSLITEILMTLTPTSLKHRQVQYH